MMRACLASCARLSHSAVPMAAVMMKAVAVVAMMVEVVPMRAMPAMMVVTMMMAPVLHVRRRELRVLLNGGRRGGIVERERVGALGGRRKRQQRADHSQSQNFHYTHEPVSLIVCHVGVERLAATLHTIWRRRLERVLNGRVTNVNGAALLRRTAHVV
jgi:hypothetical protein